MASISSAAGSARIGAGTTPLAARRGLASWLVPAVAAALITALFIVATAGGDWAAMLRAAPVLMPPAIVAALVCWLLTRRLFRR